MWVEPHAGGTDELGEPCDLLARRDEGGGQSFVLVNEEFVLGLQLLQPLFLSLTAFEGGWGKKISLAIVKRLGTDLVDFVPGSSFVSLLLSLVSSSTLL